MTNKVKDMSVSEKKVHEFSLAYIAGEKSDVRIHTSLIELLLDFATTVDKNNNLTRNTSVIKSIVNVISTPARVDSARTVAIIRWLEQFGKFVITSVDDTISIKLTKRQDYDSEWLNSCKEYPWYKVQRDMIVVKPWADPDNATKRNYATGYLMGEQTQEDLEEKFSVKYTAAIIAMATNDSKLQDKVASRMLKLDEQLAA